MGTGAHHDRSVGQREISLVRREPPFQTGLRRERARCAQQAHCGPSPRELCRGRGLSESLRDATPMLTRQRPNLFLRQPHPQTRPHDPHTRRRPRAYERLAPPAPPNACYSARPCVDKTPPGRRHSGRPLWAVRMVKALAREVPGPCAALVRVPGPGEAHVERRSELGCSSGTLVQPGRTECVGDAWLRR